MKIINSTDWPDYFLRRMVAWCCRKLELPAKQLMQARFRNRDDSSYSGHAYLLAGARGRIVASVGKFKADRIEALVRVTAHEVAHCSHFYQGRNQPRIRDAKRRNRPMWAGGSEAVTQWTEQKLMDEFNANRESLLAEWSKAPAAKETKPKASIQEQRSAKVAKSLERWQRKLKLAQTKVKQYRRKARYYEQAMAAKRAT